MLSRADIVRRSFSLVTFPLTTGPGTLAAVHTPGARIPSTPLRILAGAVIAAGFAGALRTFSRTGQVLDWPLGRTLVMTPLKAFILPYIGIQIIWTGWAGLSGIISP